jgi:hypothetical protein
MKLSQPVASRIIDDILFRQKIGIVLSVTDAWVKTLAQKNKPNGPLTTHSVVQLIIEETKMAVEEILVNEKPVLQK